MITACRATRRQPISPAQPNIVNRLGEMSAGEPRMSEPRKQIRYQRGIVDFCFDGRLLPRRMPRMERGRLVPMGEVAMILFHRKLGQGPAWTDRSRSGSRRL